MQAVGAHGFDGNHRHVMQAVAAQPFDDAGEQPATTDAGDDGVELDAVVHDLVDQRRVALPQ